MMSLRILLVVLRLWAGGFGAGGFGQLALGSWLWAGGNRQAESGQAASRRKLPNGSIHFSPAGHRRNSLASGPP